MTVAVNGRFLRATPVGLHRAARSLLDAAIGAGLETEVLAPPGVEDPRVDRHPWAPTGRLSDHAWEQLRLPVAAGRRTVLSLANTSPLAARRSAVVVHDLAPLIGPQWFTRQTQIYARLVLAGAKLADLVLTVSDAAAADLIRFGVPAGRIRVVRSAIDPSFRPASLQDVAELRTRLGLDRPYALVVGWADPRKDTATALAAHLAVVDRVPHDLVLVGREHRNFSGVPLPDLPSLKRPGYLSDADMRTLLSGAAVLLYPSHYEGYGLPPLEAWACGTPAIVSDIPSVREATEGLAAMASPGDVAAWAVALEAALTDGLVVPQPTARTWADAGRELRAAID
jgi:glycosyltransferase involved in cell wall biosynthesis